MANIAIINYCNLQCPYCFANRFITEEEKHIITDEQLDKILFFLSHDANLSRVGLIGGEPTLHPNFGNILKKVSEFSSQHGTRTTTFSNGILLGDYARLFTENNGVLINLNHPDIVGEKYSNIIKGIDRFKACGNLERVSIGINLYPDMIGYDYALDVVNRFNLDSIRCSYVAPTCKYNGVDKDKYYTDAKPLFMQFCKAAEDKGIKVRLDCNNIPPCYFSDIEMSQLKNVEHWKTLCSPVIDITPDMKATACFGAYDLIDLTQFDCISEVENYLLFKKMYPKRLNNNDGKCANCKKFNNLSCQGGCLAFTNSK